MTQIMVYLIVISIYLFVVIRHDTREPRNATNTPSNLTEGFRLTNSHRLLRSDLSDEVSSTKEQLCMKERETEAERKRRERKAKTNGPPADSMTLTRSVKSFNWHSQPSKNSPTHMNLNKIKIKMVFLISERRTTREPIMLKFKEITSSK